MPSRGKERLYANFLNSLKSFEASIDASYPPFEYKRKFTLTHKFDDFVSKIQEGPMYSDSCVVADIPFKLKLSLQRNESSSCIMAEIYTDDILSKMWRCEMKASMSWIGRDDGCESSTIFFDSTQLSSDHLTFAPVKLIDWDNVTEDVVEEELREVNCFKQRVLNNGTFSVRVHFEVIRSSYVPKRQTHDFYRPNAMSDVTIVVDRVKLHVNKSLLRLHSPFFYRLFSEDFEDNTKGEVELDEVSAEGVELLLRFMYPEGVEVTASNVENLLRLSDRLEVHKGICACEEFLTKKDSLPLSLRLLLADNFRLIRPLEIALKELNNKDVIKSLSEQSQWEQYSPALKANILEILISIV